MVKIEVFEGRAIEIHDGYMDGTTICQLNGKDFSDWKENKRTKELMEEIRLATGIPVARLIRQMGREHRSLVHPLLWPSLGQWCSRRCELWVNTLLVTHYMEEFNRAAYGEPVPIEQNEFTFDDAEGIVRGEVASQLGNWTGAVTDGMEEVKKILGQILKLGAQLGLDVDTLLKGMRFLTRITSHSVQHRRGTARPWRPGQRGGPYEGWLRQQELKFRQDGNGSTAT